LSIKHTVKLTANFERNLEEIEGFLLKVGAPHTYNTLLDELTDTIIPNLEKFPEVGRLFFTRPERSIEVSNSVERLKKQLHAIGKNGELREYVFSDYLLLYARFDPAVYLLSIRHHRQLSFDFWGLWGR
jgi:ParE toxin of type II toxin-antitoxin system, parDE